MEAKGYVSKVFPIQTGTSARTGNQWQSQEFILEYFETPSQRWADKVLLKLFGEQVERMQLKEGDILEVGFGHQVREYNGRYYNELTVPYRVEKVQESKAPQPPTQEAIQPKQEEEKKEEGDDLPF